MEKNRIRSVKTGKSMRMSYQRQKEVLEMPNLIEVQKDSYQWFLDEGLKGKERDVTYAAPLKVRVRLINQETEEINEHEIFMGDLPIMTDTGTS